MDAAQLAVDVMTALATVAAVVVALRIAWHDRKQQELALDEARSAQARLVIVPEVAFTDGLMQFEVRNTSSLPVYDLELASVRLLEKKGGADKGINFTLRGSPPQVLPSHEAWKVLLEPDREVTGNAEGQAWASILFAFTDGHDMRWQRKPDQALPTRVHPTDDELPSGGRRRMSGLLKELRPESSGDRRSASR